MRGGAGWIGAMLCLVLGCAAEPEGGPKELGGSDLSGSMSGDLGRDLGLICCGQVGDPGNSVGVGRYCQSFADCAMNSRATICSAPSDPAYRICVTLCAPMGDIVAQCGEDALCSCDERGCGCMPRRCQRNPPPGCLR